MPLTSSSCGHDDDHFRDAVREVLRAADPIGLRASGAPADEYELEVPDFIALTRGQRPVTEEAVRRVLTKWFDDTRLRNGSAELIAEGLTHVADRS